MNNIICVAGPTASGKTSLAVELAKFTDGEVISCDSMQIYRRMTIGTAKPVPEEMDGIVHHMIDICDPEEDFSVSRYCEMATPILEDILARGKTAIIAGGTGLYMDSLIRGNDFAPFPATGHRERLEEILQKEGIEPLAAQLKEIDPEALDRSQGNPRRIIRALEVFFETGETITAHNIKTQAIPPRYSPLWIGLDFEDRAELYRRIDLRVSIMLEQGLVEEIRQLLNLPTTPAYIECYDISHTAGSDPVAAMVVFENGRPLRSAYRKFRIKDALGGDDYAAMQEVLTRRMEEYLTHKDEGVGFGRRPDLILLDGGNEHVTTVAPVIHRYDAHLPVFGLVKDDRHRTRAIAPGLGETAIHRKRAAFTLLSSIQEEVHRSAIRYHRQRRKGSTISTTLLEIEGIGPGRAQALLRQFGSLRGVQNATLEELLLVKGMTRPAAEAIRRYFGHH